MATFGVAQLMHKDEQGDMAGTTSLMHIHEPPAQVTDVVQHRGRAASPAGLGKLMWLKVLHASQVPCVRHLW